MFQAKTPLHLFIGFLQVHLQRIDFGVQRIELNFDFFTIAFTNCTHGNCFRSWAVMSFSIDGCIMR